MDARRADLVKARRRSDWDLLRALPPPAPPPELQSPTADPSSPSQSRASSKADSLGAPTADRGTGFPSTQPTHSASAQSSRAEEQLASGRQEGGGEEEEEGDQEEQVPALGEEEALELEKSLLAIRNIMGPGPEAISRASSVQSSGAGALKEDKQAVEAGGSAALRLTSAAAGQSSAPSREASQRSEGTVEGRSIRATAGLD